MKERIWTFFLSLRSASYCRTDANRRTKKRTERTKKSSTFFTLSLFLFLLRSFMFQVLIC